MAKKDTEEEEELDSELDEDEDLDEENEEDDEEDEEDDLDEEDDEEDDLDEEEDEDEEDEEDEEDDDDVLAGADFADEPLGQKDPLWWTPHLVLLLLLVVGMLGFFGLFNPWLGHLAPSHDDAKGSEQPEGHSSAAPAQPAPAGRPAPTQAAAAAPTAIAAKAPEDKHIYGARHILVQFEGVRGQKPDVKRTRGEAAERAETIATEAKKTKSVKNERKRVEAFTALVDKYSDEPNAPRTRGDLGRFRDNAYEAKLVAGVKKLEVGDISDPVESPFGFHIIWRTL